MKLSFHVLSLGASLLALVCCLGTASAVRAEVLFEDRFNDGDRDNDGITDDGNETPVGTPDGIKWLAIGGQTSLGVTRPGLTIVNDDVEGGIGGGNALNVATLGANNEVMGVFPETITLGSTIGSELKLSFDVRVLDLLLPNTLQTFRFGIYQDSDNQFGQSSVNADSSPTVWGVTDGWFDGANTVNNEVGSINDFGVYARVKLGTSTPTDGDWRLYEELNVNSILGGTGDNDHIAQPVDFEAMGAKALNSNEPRHITLTLSRVAPNASGNTIMHTLDVDGLSFSGHDGNGTGSPNFDSRDSFDYFAALTTVSIANYVIDNFKIESIVADPPVGIPGDFDNDGDVDGRDFLIWQRGETTPAFDPGLLSDWQTHYGDGTLSAVTATIPEPSCLVLFMLGGLLSGSIRRRAR